MVPPLSHMDGSLLTPLLASTLSCVLTLAERCEGAEPCTCLLTLHRGLARCTPPPPVPRNRLAQEPAPGSAVEFSHHFFYQGIGFSMVLVDAGQPFRCAEQHFMCVATGPPN